MRDAIMCFLSDVDKVFLDFNNNGYSVRLFKSEYRSELDFIYRVSAYNNINPHRIGEKAEFAGVYNRKTGKIYEASWNLRQDMGYSLFSVESEETCLPIGIAIDGVMELAKAYVLKKIEAGEISAPVDISESLQRRMEYFEKYDLAEESAKLFYRHGTAKFNPWIDKNDVDWIESIVAPEAEAMRIANNFVQENADFTYNRLCEIERINAEIAKLEKTAGMHHTIRQIAESIGEAQSVWLDIHKDGKELSCKISGREMQVTRPDGEYSTYQMDAPSRRAFDNAFGKCSRLHVQDIVRVRYGKKVLYEKED